jgi:hypothetical protein
MFVEQKIAGAAAIPNCQNGQRVMLAMEAKHLFEIDRADDIHVVHKKRQVG